MADEMEKGSRVAWVTKYNGMTCGISAVHRVFEDGKTFCNVVIPEEERRLQPLKSLIVCKRCEALSARAMAYEEQQSQQASA